jgi:hypothetical protein
MNRALCQLSYLAIVGHRGIEPRNTCVSGRPLRPAGSWPAEAERVERSRPRLARVQAGCSRQSASASRAERARVELARPKLNCFRGRSRRRSGCLSIVEEGVLETHSQGATRFPDGDRTLAASSSTAESGRFERHGHSRALVSSEARYPDRFALHDYLVPFRGFEPRTSWV